MTSPKDQEWLKDYQEFIQADGAQVPKNIKTQVIYKISKLMNPSAYMVFFKILGLHLAVGFLSLSVCHQFGMNPFNTESSLADWFMRVGGHQVCMFACGTLFVGMSLLIAGYFLSIEEIKALKRTEILQNLALGIISLGFFVAFGAEMAISIAGLWLLGGFVGGVLATQTVWILKQVEFSK